MLATTKCTKNASIREPFFPSRALPTNSAMRSKAVPVRDSNCAEGSPLRTLEEFQQLHQAEKGAALYEALLRSDGA